MAPRRSEARAHTGILEFGIAPASLIVAPVLSTFIE
jgi:hypothetical protein